MKLTGPSYDSVVTTLRAAGCVWAEDEADLLIESASTMDDLGELVRNRAAGDPLELVIGWAGFRGLRIGVSAGIFIPRRRTEFLAGQAIAAVLQTENPVVVELCCGTGAISVAILNEVTGPIDLFAADIDSAAVDLTRRNLRPLTDPGNPARSVHCSTGDLYAPLPTRLYGRVNVLVANVPYVPTGDLPFLPAESRDHEPITTVDGGEDGLALLHRLAADAGKWLAPGGRVMSEVSERQVPLAESIFAGHGLLAEARADSDLGATVVLGRFTP
jgi:release factor glutamine methyltransferase